MAVIVIVEWDFQLFTGDDDYERGDKLLRGAGCVTKANQHLRD